MVTIGSTRWQAQWCMKPTNRGSVWKSHYQALCVWLHCDETAYYKRITGLPTCSYTENMELSGCQLCNHWWHRRLSLWHLPMPPVTTNLASWKLGFQFCYDDLQYHRWRQSCHHDNSRFLMSCFWRSSLIIEEPVTWNSFSWGSILMSGINP